MYADATLEAKVVILGSTGVGKTSMVIRYVQNTFSSTSTSTIGASFMTKKLTVDNCHVRLQIWDTAGQERFRAMAPMYYRGAQAAILVYDITSKESFLDMNTWVEELKRTMTDDLVIHIVGNKLDLAPRERAIPLAEAEDYASKAVGPECLVFEVSAKEDDGEIEDFFLHLAQTLVWRKYGRPESRQPHPSHLSLDDEPSPSRPGCC